MLKEMTSFSTYPFRRQHQKTKKMFPFTFLCISVEKGQTTKGSSEISSCCNIILWKQDQRLQDKSFRSPICKIPLSSQRWQHIPTSTRDISDTWKTQNAINRKSILEPPFALPFIQWPYQREQKPAEWSLKTSTHTPLGRRGSIFMVVIKKHDESFKALYQVLLSSSAFHWALPAFENLLALTKSCRKATHRESTRPFFHQKPDWKSKINREFKVNRLTFQECLQDVSQEERFMRDSQPQ